jgi:hypothetical protein
MANTHQQWGETRRATLSLGVTMKVEWMPSSYVVVTHRGTMDALIAEGCLTPLMISNRPARARRGRAPHDDHGLRFFLQRMPTRTEPERMRLWRTADPATAMQLRGVRELFPEGFPEPVQDDEPQSTKLADADNGPATAQEWKERDASLMSGYLGFLEKTNGENWSGVVPVFGRRFRLADSDIRRLRSIISAFRTEIFAAHDRAVVIDSQAAARGPSFLRLVVNNTKEMNHG